MSVVKVLTARPALARARSFPASSFDRPGSFSGGAIVDPVCGCLGGMDGKIIRLVPVGRQLADRLRTQVVVVKTGSSRSQVPRRLDGGKIRGNQMGPRQFELPPKSAVRDSAGS